MIRFTLDQASGVPLVHQVARKLRGLVAKGELKVGDYLPSVRELGAELQINFNTVAKAYRLLEREGLIEIRHGLGARIKGTTLDDGAVTSDNVLLDDLEDVINQLALRGASQEQVLDFFAEAIGKHYTEMQKEN